MQNCQLAIALGCRGIRLQVEFHEQNSQFGLSHLPAARYLAWLRQRTA